MTVRTLKPCIDCQSLTRHGTRCPACLRRWNQARNANRTGRYRGDDGEHQRDRAQWQARLDAGWRILCGRCPHMVTAETPWDLDHVDGHTRPSHAACNRAAGGRNSRGARAAT